jgi:hypothetical protein
MCTLASCELDGKPPVLLGVPVNVEYWKLTVGGLASDGCGLVIDGLTGGSTAC